MEFMLKQFNCDGVERSGAAQRKSSPLVQGPTIELLRRESGPYRKGALVGAGLRYISNGVIGVRMRTGCSMWLEDDDDCFSARPLLCYVVVLSNSIFLWTTGSDRAVRLVATRT